MKTYIQDFNTLSALCNNNGFIRRGNSFFRVHGDGVLQVLSIRRFSSFPVYYVSLGVFSMYSELLPQWFTSVGCIPNYSITIFLGHKHPMYLCDNGSMCATKTISLKQQISILEVTVMPFLNDMITQNHLIEGIKHLDMLSYNVVIWDDMLKLAPCLHSRDYSSADKVVRAIIKQHQYEIIQNNESNPPEWHLIGETKAYSQGIHPLEIFKWIQYRNEQEICNYLNTNFRKNVKSARHIILT